MKGEPQGSPFTFIRMCMLLAADGVFQVMPGAEWLALFCKHITDRYEHLVRVGGIVLWGPSRGRRYATNLKPATAKW
jgi:hypothetical protein